MKKLCTYDDHEANLNEFRKNIRYKEGRVNWCKACEKKYHAKRYKILKGEILSSSKKYYDLNKERVLKRHEEWRKYKSEYLAKYAKKYRLANLGKEREKCRRYQAKKLKATPTWLTENQILQMRDIYINCPKGYEVDHIVPLQGKNVCGLHVPWNLQHLPISENRRKNNKILELQDKKPVGA